MSKAKKPRILKREKEWTKIAATGGNTSEEDRFLRSSPKKHITRIYFIFDISMTRGERVCIYRKTVQYCRDVKLYNYNYDYMAHTWMGKVPFYPVHIFRHVFPQDFIAIPLQSLINHIIITFGDIII